MGYSAAVITVSDKGAAGLRQDTAGPALCEVLKEAGWDVVHSCVIPDEREDIKKELCACADERGVRLILTTGGTGFSPRDVTPEATLDIIERRAPGIPEAMRAESMRITPRGCLSRSEAGIRGRSLIINLPGSKKAAVENLEAVLGALEHGVETILSGGSADCGKAQDSVPPSVDQWLREAKAHPDADKIGMYLTHNGTVRRSARSRVREGDESAADVTGMFFDYDEAGVAAAVEKALKMEGIYYVRTWLARGELSVGDDIMYVLVGGDTRPHTVDALQALVGEIKSECVAETELS